jgi:hypothetical protein
MHLGGIVTYSALSREEAGAATEEILRLHPKFSLDYFAKTLPYKNPENVEFMIDGLRKAGLK